jgi:hypothetical protein
MKITLGNNEFWPVWGIGEDYCCDKEELEVTEEQAALISRVEKEWEETQDMILRLRWEQKLTKSGALDSEIKRWQQER